MGTSILFRMVLILLLIVPLHLQAQKNDLTLYSVEDGLAQSQVFAMIEDPRGFLWLGTQGGGLSQFNGTQFTTYNTRNGLLSNYIFSLFYDENNILWVGTNVGLSRFDGISFRSFMGPQKEPLEIRSIYQKRDKQLWLGTNKGIYIFENDALRPLNPRLARLNVHSIKENDQGTWIGHKGGVLHLAGLDTLAYGQKSGLPPSGISDILLDTLGNVWAASMGDGLYIKDQGRFKPVSIPGYPSRMLVWDLMEDREGRLWLGTLKHGALAWNRTDSSVLRLDDQNGLLKNHVHALVEDEWGTIWIGSSGGGLSKFAGQEFVHLGRESELKGQSVYALTIGRDSSLWFSQGNKGLGRWDGRSFQFFSATTGFEDQTIRALYTDRQGAIWAGTDGEGIFIIRDSTVDRLGKDDGLLTPWVRDFVEDQDGYMWVATTGGIARITSYQDDPTTWKYQVKLFDVEDGLPSNRVNCLYRDLVGRIWYGLNGQGIGFIEKGSLVRRVPLDDGRARKIVRCMREDTHGHLWIGTGGGVSRLSIYEPLGVPDWVHYSQKLTSSNIYLLSLDDQNGLWIGSERGLDKAMLDDKQYIIDVRHYGIADGFMGVETCRNAVIKDYEGNYWFGTISGMTRYNPRRNVENDIPPKLSVAGINLFYTPLHQTQFSDFVGPWNNIKAGLRLPHNRNHLSFEFIGINHPNPEQVTYQWILEDYENEWSPPSFKHDATYSNIPPGSYTFKVRAANEDGQWSQPIEIPFSVKLPFWQEWWFQGGAALLLALIIFIIVRVRVNRVRRKSRLEKERLIMEKSMIELEQKALRLQMNPHFIFHALNSINGLITQNDTRTARYYLSKFSHLMRQVLENSREGSISLQAEIETLENYLTLEKFSRDDQFEFDISLKGEVESEFIYIPPMIVQPFVENAIIHGLSHLKERCGKVKISFEDRNHFLLCTVEDNGIGREEARKIKSQKNEKRKSTALLVTQERLDLLQNGSLDQPSIVIEDLVDPKGKAIGTQIKIRIPYEKEI